MWLIEPGHVLYTLARAIEPDRRVPATGVYDRVTPFPGWAPPCVLTAGSAARLKGQETLIGQRAGW